MQIAYLSLAVGGASRQRGAHPAARRQQERLRGARDLLRLRNSTFGVWERVETGVWAREVTMESVPRSALRPNRALETRLE